MANASSRASARAVGLALTVVALAVPAFLIAMMLGAQGQSSGFGPPKALRAMAFELEAWCFCAMHYSTKVRGRQTFSSGWRSAATPQRHSNIAAPIMRAAPTA